MSKSESVLISSIDKISPQAPMASWPCLISVPDPTSPSFFLPHSLSLSLLHFPSLSLFFRGQGKISLAQAGLGSWCAWLSFSLSRAGTAPHPASLLS